MGTSGRVLIVGGDGMIGSALARRLRGKGRDVVTTSRRSGRECPPLDLARDANTWPLPGDIRTAYLCAAVTAIEACESPGSHAWAVNVEGTTTLARRLVAEGSHVVFLSSNMVFDGSTPFTQADAATCPTTAYGRMKAEAERRLLLLGGHACVVRLTKVFGPAVPLLVRWEAALLAGEPIHPFADKCVSPIPCDFAVDVLARLIPNPVQGILQVSSSDEVTYDAVALRLARFLDAPQRLVNPIRARQPEGPPLHATLDTSRLLRDCGIAAPASRQAIDLALESLHSPPDGHLPAIDDGRAKKRS